MIRNITPLCPRRPNNIKFNSIIYKTDLPEFNEIQYNIAKKIDGTWYTGEMVCSEQLLPLGMGNREDKYLWIVHLFAKTREKGIGKSLVDFAKLISKKTGYEGRVGLHASGCYTPNRVPHTFYKKMGFRACNNDMNKKLDEYNRKKKAGNWKEFPMTVMLYKPELEKEQSKLQQFLGIIFK